MKRSIAQTSRAAAELIAPHSASQRRRVYEWIAAHGPATRDAICDALGIADNSVRPRVKELINRGNVRVVDEAGKTKTGRKAERLMITGVEYTEGPPPSPPIPLPVQKQLPLRA